MLSLLLGRIWGPRETDFFGRKQEQLHLKFELKKIVCASKLWLYHHGYVCFLESDPQQNAESFFTPSPWLNALHNANEHMHTTYLAKFLRATSLICNRDRICLAKYYVLTLFCDFIQRLFCLDQETKSMRSAPMLRPALKSWCSKWLRWLAFLSKAKSWSSTEELWPR